MEPEVIAYKDNSFIHITDFHKLIKEKQTELLDFLQDSNFKYKWFETGEGRIEGVGVLYDANIDISYILNYIVMTIEESKNEK